MNSYAMFFSVLQFCLLYTKKLLGQLKKYGAMGFGNFFKSGSWIESQQPQVGSNSNHGLIASSFRLTKKLAADVERSSLS